VLQMKADRCHAGWPVPQFLSGEISHDGINFLTRLQQRMRYRLD